MLLRERLHQVGDMLVTIVMGTAAVVLLWRLIGGSSGSSLSEAPQPLEDVRSAAMSTMVTDAVTLGRDDSTAVIIEFADFQCPYCAHHARETFQQLEHEYVSSGKAQYVFRHLPLRNHQFALTTAQAADCAARQDKFWPMRQYLFANQSRFAEAIWFKAESDLGLDAKQFERCIEQSDRSRIQADVAEASRLKIGSTPTFLIGKRSGKGRVEVLSMIHGAQPYSVFQEALNQAFN